jgi:hypothetical protein
MKLPAFEYSYTSDDIHMLRLLEPSLFAFDELFEQQGAIYRDHPPGQLYRAVYDFRCVSDPDVAWIQVRFTSFYEHYLIPQPNRVVYVFNKPAHIELARQLLHASPNKAIRAFFMDVDAGLEWLRRQAAAV